MQHGSLEKVLTIATVLADKDIRKLLGTVIVGADEGRLNPNGIEIRLGKHVLFQSTDEEKTLSPGMYLKVLPGESIQISSLERFVFTPEAIHKIFPGCDLMALITPTTTMMREGIAQSATKVDSGWDGVLNWGLRNSSIRDFIIGYGEPIFKLTLFLLEEDEVPELRYGEREGDRYQHTDGIARSNRKVPANIPKKNVVGSSVERLDPRKQLKEAGYPFDHISTELTELHGKFEVVSSDVVLLKETIASEADKLSKKVDAVEKTTLEKVEGLFDQKFFGAVGRIVACFPILYGLLMFLKAQGLTERALGLVAVVGGIAIWSIVQFITTRKPSSMRRTPQD